MLIRMGETVTARDREAATRLRQQRNAVALLWRERYSLSTPSYVSTRCKFYETIKSNEL